MSLLVIANPNSASAKAKVKRHHQTTTKINGSVYQSVNIVLRPNNLGQLTQFVSQTTSPSSSNFRKFITPAQFASRYGQSDQQVNSLVTYLRQHHLAAKAQGGNLVINVTGKTKDFNQAFKVKVEKYNNGKGLVYQKINRQPFYPNRFKNMIWATMGLTNDHVSVNKHSFTDTDFKNNRKDMSPSKFTQRYNVTPLYNHNHYGSGQSIGIISFASLRKSDATYFWNNMGFNAKHNRIAMHYTTSEASQRADNETTLDVEQAGAVAPQANLNVYVGQPSLVGMISSLANSIGSNQNSSLSISWGQSEHQIAQQIKRKTAPKNYNQIINTLFLQAAAQGISVFSATGDSGAYDGLNVNEQYPQLTVDAPANSPYITAVGGTTLPSQYTVNGKTVSILKERAWSSIYEYPKYRNDKMINSNVDQFINSYFSGTGGGFSKYNPVPNYQKNVSGVGTFQAQQLWQVNSQGYLSTLSQPKTVTGTHSGRNVPDIVANADPNTGYVSYYKGHYHLMGGTSVVAPQFAGVNALFVDSMNHRVGFWNPQIYRLAEQNDTPFTRLDSNIDNSNIYYTGQPGKLYNQATGLGTVNVARLRTLMKNAKY